MADLVTDPVCGMQIRSEEAVATEEQRRPHLLLLSKACHDAFVSDPHRYGHPEE